MSKNLTLFVYHSIGDLDKSVDILAAVCKLTNSFTHEWTFRWPCIVIYSYKKTSRCTNFSNLFLEYDSTCFGQFLCPSSGVYHCKHSNSICHTGLLTACELDQDVSTPVWHIPLLCVQWKTSDDGQRNSPKHVEFYSKKKFEKLVHLVGFIIRSFTHNNEGFYTNEDQLIRVVGDFALWHIYKKPKKQAAVIVML